MFLQKLFGARQEAKMHVVMLGASMLDGYLSPAPSQPPHKFMANILKQRVPEIAFDFEVLAFPGYQTFEILKEFECAFEDIKPIHIAIVLGGTNDLGYGRTASETFEDLQRIYAAVHKHSPSAHIIMTTIPPCASTSARLTALRNEVNAAIRALAAREPARFSVMDLHDRISFDALGPRWSARAPTPSLWHIDGLHFSPHGYARIAELYCEVMAEKGLIAGRLGAQEAQGGAESGGAKIESSAESSGEDEESSDEESSSEDSESSVENNAQAGEEATNATAHATQ